MQIDIVDIDKPENINVIIGCSHFIMTVQDVHEMIVRTNPGMKFGFAFNEASGPCLIRKTGNDEKLIDMAVSNAKKVGSGHSFFLFIDQGYPINIMTSLKMLPEICNVICATANPVQVIVGSSTQGRGILGCIDGYSPKGVENDEDIKKRKDLLRTIGYKL